MNYPKRLIEVDLPIKRISAHASREKSIRHGHISTLHVWWARRPLAACRAVLCASVWLDPADKECPQSYQIALRKILEDWIKNHYELCSSESANRFVKLKNNPKILDDKYELRKTLIDFLSDFSDWDNSIKKEYLTVGLEITKISHQSLTGNKGTVPLVVDPFSGGGSISLEALRIGSDAFASDLNPVSVLLNKVVLEYAPKFGDSLVEKVKELGELLKEKARKELSLLYPKDADGAIPLAYLWARTIHCEGPGCGVEIPLLRSLWIARRGKKGVALKLIVKSRPKKIDIELLIDPKEKNVGEGTTQRSAASCPCCGYTTPATNVRKQFKGRNGGADDARLLAVVVAGKSGKRYRLATQKDMIAIDNSKKQLIKLKNKSINGISLLPKEELPYLRSIFNIQLLDVTEWQYLFTPRQMVALATLWEILVAFGKDDTKENNDLRKASLTCLAFAIDRLAAQNTSLSWWQPKGEFVVGTFGRQALGIIWDFAETRPIDGGSGGIESGLDWIVRVLRQISAQGSKSGHVEMANATCHPLPDNSADILFTDPPYYDAVPYADLSDFFYTQLRRMLLGQFPDLFKEPLTPKNGEIVQLAERNVKYSYKTKEYFEENMQRALAEANRYLKPEGIGVVVFAHKTTGGWESMLKSLIEAGWKIVASWPIDTERSVRIRAQDSAALASSVHLVCRPREKDHNSENSVGDWREVLAELPIRIHNWMPRLAEEGIVGADAIFACLGPALEIFSKYDRVEKANGEIVTLGQYLENVWGAVAREALTVIFEGADTSGFEEDARLTAMWLWTLSTQSGNGNGESEQSDDENEESIIATSGFSLEFDAARKISQGIGAHLEELNRVIEIKGDKARLLSIEERTAILFEGQNKIEEKRKKKTSQQTLFIDTEENSSREESHLNKEKKAGTVLDLVHQAMILFGAGRTAALKRFLVEDGVGKDQRFWKLAQALNALYPEGTNERRWVEGVQTHKKSLGF